MHVSLCSIRYFFLWTATATAAVASTMGHTMALSLPPPKRVAVVGATGQLGRRAVAQLLARNIPVKCLIRQSTPPTFLTEIHHPEPGMIEFVTNGDVTNPDTVQELLTGCSHCLALHGATARSSWKEMLTSAEGSEDSDPSHSKQINYKSMETFVKLAKEQQQQQSDDPSTIRFEHIVRITGKGETPWSFFSVLINGLGRMAKGWNYEGEQVLRQQQHLDYTIVRPGIMKADYNPQEAKVHLAVADNGGDLKVSPVSYDQMAELCVEALLHPEARRTTLTVMNVADANGDDGTTTAAAAAGEDDHPALPIAELLKRVQKDTRAFPDSLIGEHKRAVKTVFTTLFVATFLSVIVGISMTFAR